MESLLIVGASARAACRSARKAGLRVAAIDQFADADLVAAVDVFRHVERLGADVVEAAHALPAGPWMYVGGMENRPRLVERISRTRELLGNDAATLRRVRDPFLVAEAWRRRGLPFPESLRRHTNLPTDGSWLVKRFRSGGGMHVFPLRSEGVGRSVGTFVQRRVAGTAIGALYVGDGRGAHFVGACEQLSTVDATGRRPYRYGGSVGPLRFDSPLRTKAAEIGSAAAEEFGLRGLFGIDLVVDANDALWTLEINPRYTASTEILERGLGDTLLADHVRACRGDLPGTKSREAVDWHAKQIVYASGRGGSVGAEFTGMLTDLIGDDAFASVADIPRAGTHVAVDAPLATVFGRGATRDEAVAAAAERAAVVAAAFARSAGA